jgi:hypothetical protein
LMCMQVCAIDVLREKQLRNAVAVAHRTGVFPRETFTPECGHQTSIPLDPASVAVAYTDGDQKVSSSPASVL